MHNSGRILICCDDCRGCVKKKKITRKDSHITMWLKSESGTSLNTFPNLYIEIQTVNFTEFHENWVRVIFGKK
jgi:hypothetical protein